MHRVRFRSLMFGNIGSSLVVGLAVLSTACEPVSTISVTTTADQGGQSLRAAIARANGSTGTNAIRIELRTGTYQLDQCGADDSNARGDLDLTTALPVTIAGIGGGVVIRQTCAGERVLDASANGSLTLVDVTISGGSVTSTDPSPARGGAVRAAGNVTLQRATLSGNSVTGAGNSPAQGGALFVAGSLEATGSTVSSNTATGGAGTPGGSAEGGGAYVAGALTLNGSIFSENRATGGNPRGGAVAQAASASGTVNITGSTFERNVALAGAGFAAEGVVQSAAGNAQGGALALAGETTLSNATFSGNRAEGGELSNTCIQVDCRFLRLPGGNADGAAVWTERKLTVGGGSYVANVSQPGKGPSYIVWNGYPRTFVAYGSSGPTLGTAAALAVDGATFQDNTGGVIQGGSYVTVTAGANVFGAASATIRNSQLRGNRGGLLVTGELSLSDTYLKDASGLVSAASLRADRVTITSAVLPDLVGMPYRSSVQIEVTGAATLTNTTLASGGITADSLELRHVTVLDHRQIKATRLTSHGSAVIAADNTGYPICPSAPTLGGSSYNWFSDASCGLNGPGDQQSRALFLVQPVSDSPGPIGVATPAPGSVLLDAIPSAACTVASDALGAARPKGAGCDIGAVEAEPAAGIGPTDLALGFQPRGPITAGVTTNFTLVVQNKGPNATRPTLSFDASIYLVEHAFTAPAGVNCSFVEPSHPKRLICYWQSPLASGSSATVTVSGKVDPYYAGVTTDSHAVVYGPSLLAPFADDQADLSVPVLPLP